MPASTPMEAAAPFPRCGLGRSADLTRYRTSTDACHRPPVVEMVTDWMVAMPASTFLASRRVNSVVWIQARLARRRCTSRSGVLWGSISRRWWSLGEVRPASTSGFSNQGD